MGWVRNWTKDFTDSWASGWMPGGDIVPKFGLSAWYDFSNSAYLTLASTAITQALDRSGNGNNTDVQGTAAARPTWNGTLNGLTIASFDGGDFLKAPFSNPISGTDQPFTFFTVAKIAIAGASYVFHLSNSGTTTPITGLQYRSNAGLGYSVVKRDDAALLVAPVGGTYTAGVADILTAVSPGTTATLYKNNAAVFSAQNLDTGATTINQITIGELSNGTLLFNGSIAEILIYNRVLSTAEITQVNRYLSNKYAITIS